MRPTDLVQKYGHVDGEVLSRCQELVYLAGSNLTRGELYDQSRERGNDDRFAAICALQRSARAETDDVFWSGRPHFSQVYGDRYANEVRDLLRQRGVSMTAHDEYLPELAQYKGDPRAVVNRGDGRTGIRRRCEQAGVSCEGAVQFKAPEPVSDPHEHGIELGTDLVEENFAKFSASHPDEARRMNPVEKKVLMVEKHGRKKRGK